MVVVLYVAFKRREEKKRNQHTESIIRIGMYEGVLVAKFQSPALKIPIDITGVETEHPDTLNYQIG